MYHADEVYLAVVISFIFVTVLSPKPEIKNKIVFISKKILRKPLQRDSVNYHVSSNNDSCHESKLETN